MLFRGQQNMQRGNMPYLQDILKDLFQSEDLVRGAATWAKSALSILQFGFHCFTAFPFKAFGIYFSWQTKQWYSSVVCALFSITFLEYWDDHACLPFFWCFAKLPRIPPLFNAFNISSLISFSPAAFLDFNRPIAAATSLAVKTSSFPKHIGSLYYHWWPLLGSKRSSKYSLHLDRI